jgi:transcriptional regulator with XRE-family HTH domain
MSQHEWQSRIGQLIKEGMRRQGIAHVRKLEEICNLSQGYLGHVLSGDIERHSENVLRRIANALGQRVEEYRLAVMVDRDELPAPVYISALN